MHDAVSTPNAIAIGAMEGLAGEVTIYDGNVWVATPSGETIVVTGPLPRTDANATLLTLAYVNAWTETPITEQAEGAALEALIKRAATAQGLDTSKPFPFAIKGNLQTLDLHVINGYCPHATDPATQSAQPWQWSSETPSEVVIVGFYAENAAGLMTHHGTNVHAHAILDVDGTTITGHIDHVIVEPGMTLRLPE